MITGEISTERQLGNCRQPRNIGVAVVPVVGESVLRVDIKSAAESCLRAEMHPMVGTRGVERAREKSTVI